jgi:sugar-specific transcriptional regulator TrmB
MRQKDLYRGIKDNIMRPEEIFGKNAGKVWSVLKTKGPMSAASIARKTKLGITAVYGALGWLGREGKIQIISDPIRGTLYKLVE